MPRVTIDLNHPDGQALVKAQWKSAQGYVPGEPNFGMVQGSAGSPARLPDYDDSSWEVCPDVGAWVKTGTDYLTGFAFMWYRITITLPETVDGRDVSRTRVNFETCVDDYGEVWVDGRCDLERGAVEGFNRPQRVPVSANPQPGDQHTIAILAANGPLGAPGGGVFVRFTALNFEWRDDDP